MLNKPVVITELNLQLSTKLSDLNANLNSAIESRNTETKSSAGDKFETSREMAQIEIRKIEQQLFKTKKFIQSLKYNVTQLITTNQGIFFISIAYGKLAVNALTLNCISNSAPIAKYLLNTEISAHFEFVGVTYKVLNKL